MWADSTVDAVIAPRTKTPPRPPARTHNSCRQRRRTRCSTGQSNDDAGLSIGLRRVAAGHLPPLSSSRHHPLTIPRTCHYHHHHHHHHHITITIQTSAQDAEQGSDLVLLYFGVAVDDEAK